MADLFSPDEAAIIGGGQFGGEPAGGPNPDLGYRSPLDAYAADTGAPQGQDGGSLFGLGGGAQTSNLFGGGQGLGAQGMIGLGLGLMAGNPFNRFGPALQGYMQGTRADLAAQQAAATERYRRDELAYRRQALGQAYELAMKPQVHFSVIESPEGIQRQTATLWDPRTSTARSLSLDDADKLAGQPGVLPIIQDPWGRPYQCKAGENCKTVRNEFARISAKIASGEETSQEAISRVDASRMKSANDALEKDDLDHQLTGTLGGIAGGVAKSLGPGGERAFGGAVRMMGGDKYMQAQAEKNAFLNAIASRYPRQSRADLEKEFFPESMAEVNDKRALRKQAWKDMQAGAGPAFRGPPQTQAAQPKVGDRKQFKQGWGVWNGTTYVPE